MASFSFPGDAMAIDALQATSHPAAQFFIGDMQDNRAGRKFQSGIECFGLRDGAGKTIEQPTVALFGNPLQNHWDHDFIGDIFPAFQIRTGESSESGIIAQGTSQQGTRREIR